MDFEHPTLLVIIILLYKERAAGGNNSVCSPYRFLKIKIKF